MARTGFRLEPLLRIRRMKEDAAKRVVADRLRRIQQVERRIEVFQAQLAEGADQMRSLILAGRVVPADATRQRGYIGWLQGRILEAQGERRTERAHLAAERAALAEAAKLCKILERLKERQALCRRQQAERAEQRDTDELGATRFTLAMARPDEDEVPWAVGASAGRPRAGEPASPLANGGR